MLLAAFNFCVCGKRCGVLIPSRATPKYLLRSCFTFGFMQKYTKVNGNKLSRQNIECVWNWTGLSNYNFLRTPKQNKYKSQYWLGSTNIRLTFVSDDKRQANPMPTSLKYYRDKKKTLLCFVLPPEFEANIPDTFDISRECPPTVLN